jgi:hypothetical protein
MTSLILADILEAFGLGGPSPIRAATALLETLRRQPDAGEPQHHTAHNAMVLNLARSLPVESVRAMFAEAAPDAAMLLLARLVLAGEPADRIKEYLPREQRRAA